MPSFQAPKALYIPGFSGLYVGTLWSFSLWNHLGKFGGWGSLLPGLALPTWVKVGRAPSCDTFPLELLFNLIGLMQQILHLNIFVQLYNISYITIQTTQKSSHSHLIAFLNFSSNNGNLHVLEILFNTLIVLHQFLEFKLQISIVTSWNISFSHDTSHLTPSVYHGFFISLSLILIHVPLNECTIRKFSCCHANFLLLSVIVIGKQMLNFELRLQVCFWVPFSLK